MKQGTNQHFLIISTWYILVQTQASSAYKVTSLFEERAYHRDICQLFRLSVLKGYVPSRLFRWARWLLTRSSEYGKVKVPQVIELRAARRWRKVGEGRKAQGEESERVRLLGASYFWSSSTNSGLSTPMKGRFRYSPWKSSP